jgi:hypothetical protein
MFRNFSTEDLAVIAIVVDEKTDIEDVKQKKKTILSTSDG